MAEQVVMGAALMCTFGTAPACLEVLPTARVLVEGRPAATVQDRVAVANIPPFAMCTSLANPEVASATAAAMGVLTPMPCLPLIPAPWLPGAPTVLVGNLPALDNVSACECQWGGVVTIAMPGSARTLVP
ncbi:DUF4280 domain-containing protein [Bordetella bronchialis]|uniref:DUF4280 domain-containing protein n=1 Tax=Bordetella bronchialis TaxID=463025 RepID=UPI003CFC3005